MQRPPEKIAQRSAAERLLERRPDLAVHRGERRKAREIAQSLGFSAAAIDVLAAWLGGNPQSDVQDLARALQDRLQLKLAQVSARERAEAGSEARMAELALTLGWEQLRGHGPREALRALAAWAGGPVDGERLLRTADVGPAALDDLAAAGFARREGNHWEADGATVAFVDQAQADANSERRQARHAGLVRALLETATHDDDALERGALIASSAAVAAERYEVAASLAWRAAEWRRRLGDTDGASRWHGRGQSALQHLARPDLDGLFALGEGLTRLTTDGPAAALPALDRACEKLAIAEAASVPGAARALLRARLARAQCDALRGLPGGQAHLRELLERIGPDDPAARASALHTLACARMEAGDREEARQLFDEASTERGAAGGFDDAAEAALLVARSRSMRPSPPGSTEVNYLERARVLSGGDLDRRARQTLPLVLHEIGLGAGEVGETELAATLLDEAAMMAESLPEEAPVRAAVSYARGLLFLAGGDALRAEKALEKALASWERSPDGKASDRALGRAAVAWIQARRGAAPNRDAQDALLLALDALQGADAVDPGLLAQLHALHADLTSAP